MRRRRALPVATSTSPTYGDMHTHQKAMVLLAGPEKTRGLSELNMELERGWRVVHVTPMGGTGTPDQAEGPHWAALVIIERGQDRTSGALALEQVEEEVEELLEELAEGDGGIEIGERVGGRRRG